MAFEIQVKNKKFLIPEEHDQRDTWKVYFDKLKAAVGHEYAKMLWLITWEENGSTSFTTNADFNKFLKKNDIDVSNASTRAIADVSAIGGNLLGMGKKMTKVISIAAPIVLSLVLIALLVMIFNTAKKGDISTIAHVHPVGRKLNTLKQMT